MLPEPERYCACTVVAPTTKASRGVPVAVTLSSKFTAKSRFWPGVYKPFAGTVTLVTVGLWVSMVTIRTEELGPTLPATSTELALSECVPSDSGNPGLTLIDQLPPASAGLKPRTAAPSLRKTLAKGSAVPVKVGMVLLVMLSVFEAPVSVAAVITGVEGATGTV